MNHAHAKAAHIVERAAFSMLDLGTGTLAAHVGAAFDVWMAEERARPAGYTPVNDKFILDVLACLQEKLGFVW